jgi:hypothetical protein
MRASLKYMKEIQTNITNVYWFNHEGILSGLNWWRDNNGAIIVVNGLHATASTKEQV